MLQTTSIIESNCSRTLLRRFSRYQRRYDEQARPSRRQTHPTILCWWSCGANREYLEIGRIREPCRGVSHGEGWNGFSIRRICMCFALVSESRSSSWTISLDVYVTSVCAAVVGCGISSAWSAGVSPESVMRIFNHLLRATHWMAVLVSQRRSTVKRALREQIYWRRFITRGGKYSKVCSIRLWFRCGLWCSSIKSDNLEQIMSQTALAWSVEVNDVYSK